MTTNKPSAANVAHQFTDWLVDDSVANINGFVSVNKLTFLIDQHTAAAQAADKATIARLEKALDFAREYIEGDKGEYPATAEEALRQLNALATADAKGGVVNEHVQ